MPWRFRKRVAQLQDLIKQDQAQVESIDKAIEFALEPGQERMRRLPWTAEIWMWLRLNWDWTRISLPMRNRTSIA